MIFNITHGSVGALLKEREGRAAGNAGLQCSAWAALRAETFGATWASLPEEHSSLLRFPGHEIKACGEHCCYMIWNSRRENTEGVRSVSSGSTQRMKASSNREGKGKHTGKKKEWNYQSPAERIGFSVTALPWLKIAKDNLPLKEAFIIIVTTINCSLL